MVFMRSLLSSKPSYLSERAKSMIGRLSQQYLESYEEIKNFLLKEFKLTPSEYKAQFDKAVRKTDETHILFAARLHNQLYYYVNSRNVDSFDKLCDLLLCDKLKSCMSSGTLSYVLSLEGDDCFDSCKVAELSDTYVTNHTRLQVGL